MGAEDRGTLPGEGGGWMKLSVIIPANDESKAPGKVL
jgi:hypothetical protein